MTNLVQFTDFETNATRARQSHPSGEVAFWSTEWMIVVEKTQDGERIAANNYVRWIRENCIGSVDYKRDDDTGLRVFAFELDEDGILFKMSF